MVFRRSGRAFTRTASANARSRTSFNRQAQPAVALGIQRSGQFGSFTGIHCPIISAGNGQARRTGATAASFDDATPTTHLEQYTAASIHDRSNG